MQLPLYETIIPLRQSRYPGRRFSFFLHTNGAPRVRGRRLYVLVCMRRKFQEYPITVASISKMHPTTTQRRKSLMA